MPSFGAVVRDRLRTLLNIRKRRGSQRRAGCIRAERPYPHGGALAGVDRFAQSRRYCH